MDDFSPDGKKTEVQQPVDSSGYESDLDAAGTCSRNHVTPPEALARSRRRRDRTEYSPDALCRLEATFKQDRYPDIHRRETLASQLGVTEDRIQVWFQNRRSKLRKRSSASSPEDPAFGPLVAPAAYYHSPPMFGQSFSPTILTQQTIVSPGVPYYGHHSTFAMPAAPLYSPPSVPNFTYSPSPTGPSFEFKLTANEARGENAQPKRISRQCENNFYGGPRGKVKVCRPWESSP